MSFYLTPDNEHARLKSYDATIKGPVTTLRIIVEVTDTFELGMILRGLEDLKARPQPQQKRTREPATAKPRPAAKRITKQPMLALPAPYLEGDE